MQLIRSATVGILKKQASICTAKAHALTNLMGKIRYFVLVYCLWAKESKSKNKNLSENADVNVDDYRY